MLGRAIFNSLGFSAKRSIISSLWKTPSPPKRSKESIISIDCNYMNMEHRAYAFLIKENDSVAFIETNTSKAVPLLLKALEDNSISLEQVNYIIITHIHLDHAGGVSDLLSKCPNAMVVTHPRGVRHLVNPEKLIQAAVHVYGRQRFDELYGDIRPIPEERIISVKDGEWIYLNGERPLQFIFTLGHAKHHFVVYDRYSKSVFTGDSFGISYRPALRKYFNVPLNYQPKGFLFNNFNPFSTGMRDLLFPSATYPDFNYEHAHASIDKIVATGAEYAYLTHGGIWEDVKNGAIQLHLALNEYENIVWKIIDYIKYSDSNKDLELLSDDIQKLAVSKLKSFFKNALIQRGYDENNEEIYKFLSSDIELNAMGLAKLAKDIYLQQVQ